MELSSQDLSQLDEEQLLSLSESELRRLSIKPLNDLKGARERLEQNSRNSSRPPSSEAPWEKAREQSDDQDAPEESQHMQSMLMKRNDQPYPGTLMIVSRAHKATGASLVNNRVRKALDGSNAFL